MTLSIYDINNFLVNILTFLNLITLILNTETPILIIRRSPLYVFALYMFNLFSAVFLHDAFCGYDTKKEAVQNSEDLMEEIYHRDDRLHSFSRIIQCLI